MITPLVSILNFLQISIFYLISYIPMHNNLTPSIIKIIQTKVFLRIFHHTFPCNTIPALGSKM